MGCFAAIFFLICLAIFIQYWYIVLIIFTALIAWVIYYQTVTLPQKIKAIKASKIIYIKSPDDKYGIPLNIEIFKEKSNASNTKNNTTTVEVDKYKVLVGIPILNKDGSVEIVNSYHDIDKVEIINNDFIKKDKKLKSLYNLSDIMKETIAVDREIVNLEKKYLEMTDVANLIASSDIYSSQIDKYERGLAQIENLLRKSMELNKLYLHLIREGLISYQVAKYDIDNIPDNIHISLDSRYRQVKEEYQNMKDTAEAYFELLSQSKKLR